MGVCRICLESNTETSVTVAEDVLNDLERIIPPLNNVLKRIREVCETCSENIMCASYFINTANSTESRIRNERKLSNLKIIDLRTFRSDKPSFTGDVSICRICLKFIRYPRIFLYDNNVNIMHHRIIKKMMKACYIKLRYELTNNPVMCTNCWTTLQSLYTFKKMYMEIRVKVGLFCKLQNYPSRNITEDTLEIVKEFFDTDFEDSSHSKRKQRLNSNKLSFTKPDNLLLLSLYYEVSNIGRIPPRRCVKELIAKLTLLRPGRKPPLMRNICKKLKSMLGCDKKISFEVKEKLKAEARSKLYLDIGLKQECDSELDGDHFTDEVVSGNVPAFNCGEVKLEPSSDIEEEFLDFIEPKMEMDSDCESSSNSLPELDRMDVPSECPLTDLEQPSLLPEAPLSTPLFTINQPSYSWENFLSKTKPDVTVRVPREFDQNASRSNTSNQAPVFGTSTAYVNDSAPSPIVPPPSTTKKIDCVQSPPSNIKKINVVEPPPFKTKKVNVVKPQPSNTKKTNEVEPPPSKTKNVNVKPPPSKTRKTNVEEPPPSKTKNINVKPPPSKTRKTNVEEPPPSKTKKINVKPPPSKTKKINVKPPPSKTKKMNVKPPPPKTKKMNVVEPPPVKTEEMNGGVEPTPSQTIKMYIFGPPTLSRESKEQILLGSDQQPADSKPAKLTPQQQPSTTKKKVHKPDWPVFLLKPESPTRITRSQSIGLMSNTEKMSSVAKYLSPMTEAEPTEETDPGPPVLTCEGASSMADQDWNIQTVEEKRDVLCTLMNDHNYFTTDTTNVTRSKVRTRRTQGFIEKKMHRCRMCPFTSFKRCRIGVHMEKEHQTVLYPLDCSKCSYRAPNLGAHRMHSMQAHIEEGVVYKCTICNYIWDDKSLFTKHMDEQHNVDAYPFHCFECDYTTTNRFTLSKHMSMVHMNHSAVEHCHKCSFSGSRLSLIKHSQEEHMAERRNRDEQSSPTNTETAPPLQVQMPCRRSFQCVECAYIAADISSVKQHASLQHARQELAEEKFVCLYSHCNFSLFSRKKFDEHMRLLHNDMYNCDTAHPKNADVVKDQQNSQQKQQPTCKQYEWENRKFLMYGKLIPHDKGLHLPAAIGHECQKCDDSAQNTPIDMRFILNHMSIKTSSYHCSKCDFSTKSKYLYKQHMINDQIKYKYDQFYICNQCSFQSQSIKGLRLHESTKHDGIPAFGK